LLLNLKLSNYIPFQNINFHIIYPSSSKYESGGKISLLVIYVCLFVLVSVLVPVPVSVKKLKQINND